MLSTKVAFDGFQFEIEVNEHLDQQWISVDTERDIKLSSTIYVYVLSGAIYKTEQILAGGGGGLFAQLYFQNFFPRSMENRFLILFFSFSFFKVSATYLFLKKFYYRHFMGALPSLSFLDRYERRMKCGRAGIYMKGVLDFVVCRY